jgi:hypothetical protein
MKAILKKDVQEHKAGTVFTHISGVFVSGTATFMAEDVLTDDYHFELITEDIYSDDMPRSLGNTNQEELESSDSEFDFMTIDALIQPTSRYSIN